MNRTKNLIKLHHFECQYSLESSEKKNTHKKLYVRDEFDALHLNLFHFIDFTEKLQTDFTFYPIINECVFAFKHRVNIFCGLFLNSFYQQIKFNFYK